MMLDDKGRVIAERLGLDVVIDELLVALAGINIRPAVAGRPQLSSKAPLPVLPASFPFVNA